MTLSPLGVPRLTEGWPHRARSGRERLSRLPPRHIKHVGSRASLLSGSAGTCVFCGLLTVYRAIHAEASTALLVLFIILRGAIQWPGIAVYTLPNTFAPTRVRARAHGLAAAIGKLGAIIGSAAYPLILSYAGLVSVFLVSSVVCGLSAAAVGLVPASPRAIAAIAQGKRNYSGELEPLVECTKDPPRSPRREPTEGFKEFRRQLSESATRLSDSMSSPCP